MKKLCLHIVFAFTVSVLLCSCISAKGKKDNQENEPNSSLIDVSESDEESVQSEPAEEELNLPSVRAGVLSGSSAIPVAYMFSNEPDLGGKTVSFKKFKSAPDLLREMIAGGIDICFMPAAVAAKIYNTSGKAVVCAGVCGNGNLSLITKDKSINNFSDLLGKKVFVSGKGGVSEYVFRWLLEKNLIPTESGDGGVLLDYSVSAANIVPQLLSGKIQYAVVPEPFVSVIMIKSRDMRAAINLQDEFAAVEGNGALYPLTLIVAGTRFAESEPETVRAFINAYRESLAWTTANPQKAGVLVQKNSLGVMAPVAAAAIPKSNFAYESAVSARPKIEKLLEIFMQFDPDSIGGKLPAADFYFE